MKFKVRVTVGVNFPGAGLTKKNKEFDIEAPSASEALSQAGAKAREAFPGAPTDYASWQVSLALNTGAAEAKADEKQPEPQPAAAAAPAREI